ncbi:von Willebrand factor type A domain-containing protein, partial [Cladophialophora immunda]
MFPTVLCLPFIILFASISDAYLLPRDSAPVCTNLRVNSNNGDRKIALVIDSSGSMEESDPYNYRLSAAKMVLDWLISKSEVTSTQKQDKVTVINFDDEAYLDYPLGDPDAAASSLAQIGAEGGTYIAGGVQMAIKQLTAANTGDTAGRSGILVFTDGEDSSTSDLVDQIDRATSLGIRVAFGFLDDSSGLQDTDVLSAIMHSGGRYFTIQNYNASKEFIDGIIVNGLTKNDNPDGDTTTLLAGLDASHFISGSETQTMTYSARAKEQLTFNVQSVNAGTLAVQIVSGGKTLAKGQADYYSSYYSSGFSVIAPSTDTIDVKVTADNADKNSIFVVGVTSNLPPENCTVGVGDPPKENNVPQIVEGTVSSVVGLLLLSGIAYIIYKYCYKRRGKRHHYHDKDHSSDCSHDPKHSTTTTVQETPAPNPDRVPWFSFPPPLPPTHHHPPKHTRTTDDHDRDMDEDSGSEAPSDDSCDNQSQFSNPPDKLNDGGPPCHNGNPPSSQPSCQTSNPPYQNASPPSLPSCPNQPPNPNQPSHPSQPSNPNH